MNSIPSLEFLAMTVGVNYQQNEHDQTADAEDDQAWPIMPQISYEDLKIVTHKSFYTFLCPSQINEKSGLWKLILFNSPSVVSDVRLVQ